MHISYEWAVETRATGEDREDEILETEPFPTAKEALDYLKRQTVWDATDREARARIHQLFTTYRMALVRDDDEGRLWAYTKDGALPEVFENAWQSSTGTMVPDRFHKELKRALDP